MSRSSWLGPVERAEGPRASPPGCVLTVLRGHEVIVWLIGEIDANLILDLHDIAEQVPDIASHLVIDGSRVTFCDSTAVRFIATAATAVPVTLRRPSRVLTDIVAFSGLDQNPRIQIEPGVLR